MDGQDIHVKNTKTGKSPNAKSQSVWQQALAQRLSTATTRQERRLTPEDVHARLILIIGGTLAFTFAVVTLGVVYPLS